MINEILHLASSNHVSDNNYTEILGRLCSLVKKGTGELFITETQSRERGSYSSQKHRAGNEGVIHHRNKPKPSMGNSSGWKRTDSEVSGCMIYKHIDSTLYQF